MAIKKKNTVNAEFNSAALTDIIFLLLIFFMLTSSVVVPNAINLKLPGSSRAKLPSKTDIERINIGNNGQYFLNGKRIALEDLEAHFETEVRRYKDVNVSVSTAKDATNGDVVAVLDMAMRLNFNAILATQ
ncbi:MAG: biopolymer transporter ExbD [Saprospiraceae bacterium]|nr:biopolymer transporter ExbD [Saprospiraceae bacterium]